MTDRPVYGLVLAGGKSRRLGQDKALLDHDGESQLAYAAGVLGDCVDRVFVSTRAGQRDDAERGRFEQIVDRYESIGPIAGILSALDAYPKVDWLVVACDLPNIDADTVCYLLHERDDSKPFTAYLSSYDGLPEPLCAIYSATGSDILRQYVDDGVHCPRKMLIRSDTQLLDQPNPRSLDNVNTPRDLQNSVLRAAR